MSKLQKGKIYQGDIDIVTGLSPAAYGDGTISLDGVVNFTRANDIAITNQTHGNAIVFDNILNQYNMLIGFHALESVVPNPGIIQGVINIAIGNESLKSIVTGYGNIGIGWSSMWQNITGSLNVSVGSATLFEMISGSLNTACGNSAGTTITNGSSNVFVGATSGHNVSTGSYNTFIGSSSNAGVVLNASEGRIGIGYGARVVNDYWCQIGQPGLGSHGASLQFYNQIVSQEAWMDTFVRLAYIDATGNMQKANDPVNGLTYNPATGSLTIPGKLTVGGLIDPTGVAMTIVAANPGGALAATTWWDFTGGIPMHGSTPVVTGPASSTTTAFARWNGANGGALFNETVTGDGLGNMASIRSASFTAVAANPGGANTLWNFTGNVLYFGSSLIMIGAGAVTNTALARWNGISGSLLSNSTILLDAVGNETAINSLTLSVIAANPGGSGTIWSSAGPVIRIGSRQVTHQPGGSVMVINNLVKADGTAGGVTASSIAESGGSLSGLTGTISSPTGITFTVGAANPGGINTMWDFTGSVLRWGATDLIVRTAYLALTTNSIPVYTGTTGMISFSLVTITTNLIAGTTGATITSSAVNPGGAATLWNRVGTVYWGTNQLVQGPDGCTANALALWSGTTGSALLNSSITVTGGTAMTGVTTLGVSGVITSSLTGATANLLNWTIGGVVGNYSYLGNSASYAFGQMNGSGMFVSSDNVHNVRLGTIASASNYFRLSYGVAPIGANTIFTIDSNGDMYFGAVGQHISSFSTDVTMGGAGASNIRLSTQLAVKTYVDGKIGGSVGAGTLNHVARYDATNGIKQAVATVLDDSDNFTGILGLSMTGTLSLNTLPITYTSVAPYQLEAYKATGGTLIRIGGATNSAVLALSGGSTNNGSNCLNDMLFTSSLPLIATYAGSNNTMFGIGTGTALTAAMRNSGFGTNSLQNLTSGDYNSAFGHDSLVSLTTGSSNSAFGEQAGVSIGTASNNTVFGCFALMAACLDSNTAFGMYALTGCAGTENVGVGYYSGSVLTAASAENTFCGTSAGRFYTNAVGNTSVGYATGPLGGAAGSYRFEYGWNARATADYCGQLGQATISPLSIATLSFRSQKVSDETWTVGGVVCMAYIDATGNMQKASGANGIIYDPATGVLTGKGLTLSTLVTNPGGVTNLWNDANYLYRGTEAVSVGSLIKNPTGFDATNRAASTFTIVTGATPTFTISGPFTYWISGVPRTVPISATVAITNVEGMHYFSFAGATLTEYNSFTVAQVRDEALVAMVYWHADIGIPANQTYYFLGDERHEFMPWETHWELHNALGTRYISGLALDGFTIGSGALNAHAQMGFSAGGSILDEDITHTIPSTAAPATIPVFRRTGPTAWTRISPSTSAPVTTTGTGRLAYNSFSTPNWGLTEVTNGNYVLYHIFATNAYAAGDRMISIMGQAQYTSIANARTGANNELNSLVLSGLPTPEFLAVGTIIYQTNNTYVNTWKARVVLTDTGANYVNWIQKNVLNATASPTSHHNLADLTTGDDHTQYMLDPTGAVLDTHIAVWDGTTGRIIKSTGVIIDGLDNMSGVVDLTMSGTFTLNTLPFIYNSGANQLQAYKSVGGSFINIGGATNSLILANFADSTHNGSNCNSDVIIANALPVTLTYSGGSNTMIGYTCGSSSITSAAYVSSFGYQALSSITTGSYSCAFGAQALKTVTTGQANSAFGYNSGGLLTSANNCSFGYNSIANVCGDSNSGFGRSSLQALGANGTLNAAFGFESGKSLSATASYNSFLGGSSGTNYNSSSSRNTSIGYNTGPSVGTLGTERLELGYQAAASADYCAQLCQAAASGTSIATAKFRSHIFSNEAWSEGTVRLAYIDATGNIVKASDVTNGLTYDPATGSLTIPGKLTVGGLIDPTGIAMTTVAANPGGALATTTWWDLTGAYPRHGADAVVVGPTVTVDNQVMRWDGITAKSQGNTLGITLTDTGAFVWPQIAVDGTFRSAMVWYPDSTVNGTEQAITWGTVSTRHTGFAIKYKATILDTIVRAHSNVLVICDGANGFTDKKIKFMHNGVDDLATEMFSIAENNSLQIGGAGALINEFSIDGTMAGNSDTALPTEQSVVTYVAKVIGNQTVTFSGPWALPQSTTVSWSKIGSSVTLTINNFRANCTVGTSMTSTAGTVLPSTIRPSASRAIILVVPNNGTEVIGEAIISTTGYISIDPIGGTFVPGNFAGVGLSDPVCITYTM
jgi:hypothetical protein